MKEVIANSGLARGDLEDTRFLFSLPRSGSGRPEPLSASEFLSAYFERLAVAPPVPTVVYQDGHTGTFTALVEAVKLLQQGACRFCILVGVDSYLDPATLRWLDEAWRLKSARNVDGFIPGECATAFLVELKKQARTRNRPVLARIGRIGASTEPNTVEGAKLSTGQGLTQAIRSACGDSVREEPFWTICNLNGESYRAHEWGLCLARLGEALTPQQALWHPSDCLGDVGAASGGLYAAMACRAFARRYAPTARALLWASSDGETRTACILHAPD
ncbi:hypothetical protein [Pyxidicoccus caerfyrddinensis]|uniref:hypothetical protein n=1 Tax=Pyxidicoccus caerfyrddinensis TaxID=2709663 RepID=UPI0013DA31C8|nr:hypothetical protein [Pyxidicoccus caerfyrddinensis]